MADPIPNIKDVKDLNKELGLVEDALTSISVLLKDKIQEAFANVEDQSRTIAQIYANNLEKSIKSMARNSDSILKNTLGILAGENKSKDIQKQLLNIEISKLAQERNIKMLKENGLIDDIEMARLQADLTEQYEAQKTLLQSQNKLTEDISKKIGLTGKLLGELDKIPIIGKFIDSKDALAKMNVEAAKGSSKLKVLGAGFSAIGSSLAKNLTDPVTILTFFIQSINKADKQATELAKTLGVSKDQAFQLRENTVAYSRAVNDTFVNTDRLIKAQSELSEQLGISVMFANKEAETFSRLTELVGLTATEAANLTKFSAAAGKEIGKYEGDLLKGAFYTQQTTKSHFSAKQILQDVSKLSAGILIKFQGNPEALGKAVAQARALGTSLEQVDKTAESLLNFESSIENELKAELITGRQLNFERARAAALTGDQATLMQEVTSQAGSLADFQNMNVIAQKSLADAFSMSRDEMADMLLKQETINKYGDKAAELNAQQLKDFKESGLSLDDYLKKQSEQRSIQDKFTDAMTKLQDIVGNLVAGPFGAMLDMLSNILNVVGLIAKPFTFFGYVIDQITGGAKGFASVLKGILATAVAIGIVMNPLGTLASLAAGGVAIAAAEALTGKTYMAEGGVVTSRLDNATIGEAGPEAIIPLNSPKADKILGGGASVDLTPMIAAINEVKAAITQLGSRPSVAYINGKDAFSRDVSTTSVQNTYKLA
jgi:hypothetical protein